MTKEEYMEKRKGLVDSAQALIDGGKLKEAADKTEEIKELDDKFDAESKAQANLNALSGAPKIVDISTAGKPVAGIGLLLGGDDAVLIADVHDSGDIVKIATPCLASASIVRYISALAPTSTPHQINNPFRTQDALTK